MNNNLYNKLAIVSDELACLLGCSECCEERCVFPDVGTGEGCPLNEFMNRVEDAIERSE